MELTPTELKIRTDDDQFTAKVTGERNIQLFISRVFPYLKQIENKNKHRRIYTLTDYMKYNLVLGDGALEIMLFKDYKIIVEYK